ncbi:MAG: OmpA family protein, partial [Candidatus Kapaibacterium sp.]
LHTAAKMDFRPSANKVFVLITDAPYHYAGDRSKEASTKFTTESMIDFLKARSIRTFCIAPTVLREYKQIAEATRGSAFDLYQNFAKLLDAYSTQLTNLFAITYRSDAPAIPDSINVAVVNERKEELLRKTIPLADIGRKLIIEDLLFPTGKSTLPDSVGALELLTEFMRNQPKVVVRIEGHTDNRGNPVSNKKLSLSRAESVRRYLVQRKGIDVMRIQIAGLGDTRPIADNGTDFGRRLNRRTEVVIVSK